MTTPSLPCSPRPSVTRRDSGARAEGLTTKVMSLRRGMTLVNSEACCQEQNRDAREDDGQGRRETGCKQESEPK